MDWNKAIAILEQANAALIDCPGHDLPRLENAMLARDRAVHAINGLDPRLLAPQLAARLKAAFEAGADIRTRLSAIYRDAHAELHRTHCIRRFVEPGISAEQS
ncbi:MAG TPA: hypothetical protein VFA04_15940 [Bryobacteraceae bacterium]|nr:hypothetical protein [Bryobacteraceae bacterium]